MLLICSDAQIIVCSAAIAGQMRVCHVPLHCFEMERIGNWQESNPKVLEGNSCTVEHGCEVVPSDDINVNLFLT